jgi:hypothetical protein
MSNPVPAMIFFSGTSAVGKSSTLDALDPLLFVRVPMTARAERERMGNPSWDSLLADVDLAIRHQETMLTRFMTIMHEASSVVDCKHQVFERCLYDVVGYSYAFKCPSSFLDEQVKAIKEFEYRLTFKRRLITSYFPISYNFPYAIEDARPPETVREACNDWLISYWSVNNKSRDNYFFFDKGVPEKEPLERFACRLLYLASVPVYGG